jgi:hypothetical protein
MNSYKSPGYIPSSVISGVREAGNVTIQNLLMHGREWNDNINPVGWYDKFSRTVY